MAEPMQATHASPSVIRRRPARLRGLLVCESASMPVARHLLTTGQERHEEAALWAGYLTSQGVGIVTTALLPYTEHDGAGCFMPVDVAARCYAEAKKRGQLLLAQIHTHPGRSAHHSRTDDDWAVCGDTPGFLSIVVPCFARFGLERIFRGGALIHERMASGQWREVPLEEVRRRFWVISSHCAVV